MPITSQQVVVTHLLARLSVDVETMTGEAVLRRYENGDPKGEVKIPVTGANLAALIGANPIAGYSRADDAALAVYEYAVANGYVSGEIS